jgi:uncharacterized cofD-like protein
LFCEPRHPVPLKEAIEAIKEADIIIMGPGSLYTSVIPNLLIDDIAKEVANSKAAKAYICNVMTQPGETDNYTVSDHLKAIIKHANSKKIVDTVFVNNELPKNLAEKYQKVGSFPVKYDRDEIKKMGIKIVKRKLIEDNKNGLVRHSYNRLARLVNLWWKSDFDVQKVNTKIKRG